MKSTTRTLLIALVMASSLPACGSKDRDPKVSQLNLTDELVFPTKGENLITLEEVPEGRYAIKQIQTFTQSDGVNRVLYKLSFKTAGKEDRAKDLLEVKAKWENSKLAGGFVSMAGAVPLAASMQDGVLDLNSYKLLKMEASNGEKPSYSFEATPGNANDRGQYSILFSDLATRNGNVYAAIGMEGTIELEKKVLSLYTVSKSKGYSIVTKFTYEPVK